MSQADTARAALLTAIDQAMIDFMRSREEHSHRGHGDGRAVCIFPEAGETGEASAHFHHYPTAGGSDGRVMLTLTLNSHAYAAELMKEVACLVTGEEEYLPDPYLGRRHTDAAGNALPPQFGERSANWLHMNISEESLFDEGQRRAIKTRLQDALAVPDVNVAAGDIHVMTRDNLLE